MKKRQYTTPQMEVVRLVFQANIMAGSPGITTNEESADQHIEVLSPFGFSFEMSIEE